MGESLFIVYKRCHKVRICVCGLSVGRKQAAYSWSGSTSVGEVSASRDKKEVNEGKFKKN